MAMCAKCGDDAPRGITIKGKDYCYPCVDTLQAEKDTALVDRYPHDRVRVHDHLNFWRKDQKK